MSIISLINSENNININYKLIKLLGCQGAVYYSILMKNIKDNNDFIPVDRKFIKDITCLNESQQLQYDNLLEEYNLIDIDIIDKNLIKFKEENLVSLLLDKEFKINTEIKNIFKIKKEDKKIKNVAILQNLKKYIDINIPEVKDIVEKWVESLYNSKKVVLTKEIVSIYSKCLYEYCDLNNNCSANIEKAIKVTEYAISQNYKQCQFAINLYEQNLRKESQNKVRVTEQKTTTELSDIKF